MRLSNPLKRKKEKISSCWTSTRLHTLQIILLSVRVPVTECYKAWQTLFLRLLRKNLISTPGLKDFHARAGLLLTWKMLLSTCFHLINVIIISLNASGKEAKFYSAYNKTSITKARNKRARYILEALYIIQAGLLPSFFRTRQAE